MLKVLLVEDENLIRRGLQYKMDWTEVNCVVVGEAATGQEGLTQIKALRPDIVITDIRMPDMMGTELFDELLNRNYPHPVLFMTAFGDIESAVTAMKKGAVDYLVKPVAAEKLFAGVVNALKIDRKRREGLVGSPFWSDRWASLTDREREVVKLVAQGLMSRQIAIELDISQRTVEVHRASGLKKLQIQTPAQAALVLSEIEDQNRTL